MGLPAEQCSCARIPLGSLPALAALRARAGVSVAREPDRAWVHWRAGDATALLAVLAVPGAELYAKGEDRLWRRLGARLPTSDVKEGKESLAALLALSALDAIEPPAVFSEQTSLHLAASSAPRPTSAALVALAALERWADSATTVQFLGLQAARAGSHILVLGETVPPLAGSERFWGDRVLVPLGQRLEPPLREKELLEVLGAKDQELALFRASGVELVPRSAFKSLTRANVRLAARGGAA